MDKSYFFQTWDKLELPIDYSKIGFVNHFGYKSFHKVDNALNALDGANKDVLSVC